ncbi:hypothetical protein [Streptosporangium roseum]|uniref:hypothetical protein n=1 Tax=Streptosporangium roseum TaxID=2001 RepID=UPI0033226BA5
MTSKAAPASINQALAAVTLLYFQVGLRIDVKRATVPKPGEPDAARRTARDEAIMLYTGAREEECARLDIDGIAITARTVPIPPIARTRISACSTSSAGPDRHARASPCTAAPLRPARRPTGVRRGGECLGRGTVRVAVESSIKDGGERRRRVAAPAAVGGAVSGLGPGAGPGSWSWAGGRIQGPGPDHPLPGGSPPLGVMVWISGWSPRQTFVFKSARRRAS